MIEVSFVGVFYSLHYGQCGSEMLAQSREQDKILKNFRNQCMPVYTDVFKMGQGTLLNSVKEAEMRQNKSI